MFDKPYSPMNGIVTRELKNGLLYKRDWLACNEYHMKTMMCVKHAQNFLISLAITDVQVKEIWIEIESICAEWRRKNNLEIAPGQRYLPVGFRVGENFFLPFNLGNDNELFWYLADRHCRNVDSEIDARILRLLERPGRMALITIVLLYENHIGRHDDVMSSFISFFEHESQLKDPHVKTVQKLSASGLKGHIATYGTADEREEKYREYQKFINDLYERLKKLSYREMKAKAAKHFGVSSKTIGRYTKNPKKT